MRKKPESIIPPQHTGVKTDVKEEIEQADRNSAITFYNIAKQRLLDVNRWREICGGGLSSEFKLTDDKGNFVEGPAREGLKFRIDLTAPGTVSGDGYDWVNIEEIVAGEDPDTDCEFTAIRVRPCANPSETTPENNTSHFYTHHATSSFLVKRVGRTVHAEVHGRNEKPNTTEAENILDKARNAAVAVGAILGLHKPQWKALVKGILMKD